MASFKIKVPNWRVFNPRKDVKKSSWFRLAHDLFENEDFYSFTPAEFLSWIYILCACSKKNHDTVVISIERVKKVGRIKPSDFRSAVDKLVELECITLIDTSALRERDEDDTDTNATGRTGRDERDGTGHETEETRTAPPPPISAEDQEAAAAKNWAREAELEEARLYYAEQFYSRHTSMPIIRPRDIASIEKAYDELGADLARLKRLLNAYVYMNDEWFGRMGWNLQTFAGDLPKISARVAV